MGPVMGGAGRCMRAAPGAIEQMSMRESCLRPPRRRPAQREAVGRQWHGGCVPAAPELAPVGRRMRRTHPPSLCSQMGNAMRAERSSTFMRAGEWSDSSAHYRIPALCAQRAIPRSINRGTAQSWFVQRPRTAARSSCFRVKTGECVGFAARLRRSLWWCSRLCRTVLGRRRKRAASDTRPLLSD